MYYYKDNNGGLYASSSPIVATGIIEIEETEYQELLKEMEEVEYEEYMASIELTEEEIREEKERQLRKLMLELYPPEEV